MSATETENKLGTRAEDAAARLNRDCHCETLDVIALQHELLASDDTQDLYRALRTERPNLLSTTPVFISPDNVAAMARIVAAVETVVALPAYRTAVFAYAPEIARHTPPARGVFLGYDFHLSDAGPQLIEINTNAGGALINTVLARTQQTCCAEVGAIAGKPALELEFFGMFMTEWHRARADAPLRYIAIVDSAPDAQYLAPEFALFKRLFTAHGITTDVVDPGALVWREGALWRDAHKVDLIYNRLTDFALAEPAHAHLRAAYLADAVVLTPHPQQHALYADKRNLVALSDAGALADCGAAPADVATLTAGIARTLPLTAKPAATWWQERRQWFFKPAGGYGSKAVYRGDKLTRGVWDEIVAAGDYVAQARVAPSERRARGGDAPVDFKIDWRNYVYAGEVQLVAARLYQGQTTNFRTAGGGFAPVFLPRDAALERCPHAAATNCATSER